jgi:hypothetical protein
MDDSWFKIDKQSTRDIVLIICLVKEDILPVFALGCIRLENAIRSDSMLCTKLLPKLISNFIRVN